MKQKNKQEEQFTCSKCYQQELIIKGERGGELIPEHFRTCNKTQSLKKLDEEAKTD